MILKVDELRENIKEIVIKGKEKCKKLVIFTLGDDEASKVYVKNKIKFGQEVGIEIEYIICKDEEDLRDKIAMANINPNVTGIIVQLPLKEGVNEREIIDLIVPYKDVDGLTTSNKKRLYNNEQCVIPATALGCLLTLREEYTNGLDELSGKDILLIGRQDLCNLPLAHILRELDATVTMAHSKTRCLGDKIRACDIVITAVGKPNLITQGMIGEDNKIILDVAICRDKNGKLCGDVDKEIYEMNNIKVTSVPNGIGSLTVPCLFLNLINM